MPQALSRILWAVRFAGVLPFQGFFVMTIRELAKALKLSPATVSLALSGEGVKYNLSAETIARVREFAEQSGYVPNRLAIKLFSKEADQTIGVLFLQGSSDDRTMPVLSRVMRYLEENNREFQVYSCHDFYLNPSAYATTLRYMRGMGLKKILIVGTVNQNYPMDPALYEGVEIYAMDFDAAGIGIPPFFRSVGLCNRQEFHTWLVRAVIAQGRGPILTQAAIRYYVDGWTDDYGVFVKNPDDLNTDLFAYGRKLSEYAAELFRQGRCRTFLSHTDRIATGMLNGLLERGLRVPEDIQVIGYNDSEYAGYTAVPLSSVRSPAERHTLQALEHLVKGTPLPKVLRAPLELVQRKSSYPLGEGAPGC